MQYKRILLKLSGEALMGKRQYGIDPDRLAEYAEEIKQVLDKGVQVAIVIGGGNIYEQFLPQAERLYLTFIDLEVEGDTQFPDYESVANWTVAEQEQHQPDNKNPYSYTFVTLYKNS